MVFPFTLLPTELALEIVRIAGLPSYDDATAPRPSYATALAMTAVSHSMRSAAMPHLLHSVVLASSDQVLSFIDSILLQKQLCASSSALALDYTKLVRRFWSTECWEALMDDSPDYCINYSALYEIIRDVDSLGFNFRSLHLLYNGLASAGADPARDWQCRRVTLAGSNPRWKPLTSSVEGITFLSRITHLTLWISIHNHPWHPPAHLTHLAFPLLPDHIPIGVKANPDVFQLPTETLVYFAPSFSVDFKPSVFREWALGDDPLSHGAVVPFRHALPNCHRGNKERPGRKRIVEERLQVDWE
ncbi:hypothetical protein B0H19DRAFT_1246290 [Mycena capillaripes]|nr:hypothetical protein B0H19DRAFT_1246290 [Mycena capillaripes]